MHDAVIDFCRRHANGGPGKGLDIGGRDLNGHARDLWPNVQWSVLDSLPGEGVQIVSDACTWVPDDAYHLVLCTEVL